MQTSLNQHAWVLVGVGTSMCVCKKENHDMNLSTLIRVATEHKEVTDARLDGGLDHTQVIRMVHGISMALDVQIKAGLEHIIRESLSIIGHTKFDKSYFNVDMK